MFPNYTLSCLLYVGFTQKKRHVFCKQSKIRDLKTQNDTFMRREENPDVVRYHFHADANELFRVPVLCSFGLAKKL